MNLWKMYVYLEKILRTQNHQSVFICEMVLFLIILQ